MHTPQAHKLKKKMKTKNIPSSICWFPSCIYQIDNADDAIENGQEEKVATVHMILNTNG